jgi:chitosanase
LSPGQKSRADALISWFENGTTVVQYAYVEKLGDGRGYTAGRGFTTGTGDVYTLVKAYAKRAPRSPLAAYLKRLRTLADERGDGTDGLEGFPASWKQAAEDPAFRAEQDRLNDEQSYEPAMRLAQKLGLRTALARVALYDAVVVHGDGGDPDGAPALAALANKKAGGTPKQGVDERKWLRAFLAARKADMLNPRDPATRKVWAEAADRCDAFTHLLDAGDLAFHGPLKIPPIP